jgi:hypothetical protein
MASDPFLSWANRTVLRPGREEPYLSIQDVVVFIRDLEVSNWLWLASGWRCRARRVRQGAVRTQKFSSMTALTSYRRKPNARYLPSRDGRGSKIHAGPTGPLSIVFALPSRLTEAIWNVSPTVPET